MSDRLLDKRESGSPARRNFIQAAASLVALFLSGCSKFDMDDAGEQPRLTDPYRDRILDSYAVARRARRTGSTYWTLGRDAWVLNYYGKAASDWGQSGRFFAESYRQFARAGEYCRQVDAKQGEQVCNKSRDYSKNMRASAEAHAKAAELFATGETERGKQAIDRGYQYYQSALDHEIESQEHLENILKDKAENDR